MNSADFPQFDDIQRNLGRFAQDHSDIAHLRSLGKSPEGREITALQVTDPQLRSDDKEIALVVCGRHGNELGTRAVGPALLDWLASGEAAQVRRSQLTIVVPVANPDGCARGEFHAPSTELSRTETATIAALAETCQPDLVLDVHSLGAGDLEAIITANTTLQAEDDYIHGELARRAVQAAARAGFPFLVEAVPRAPAYNNFFCERCYNRFHSLVFGMEVNHFTLRPEEAARSGVAAITGLFSSATQRFPWEPHPAYPNRVLVGNFATSIRGTGATARARRESRSLLWQNRTFFQPIKRETPHPGTVRVTTAYSGDDLPCALSLCCRLRGHHLAPAVSLNGRRLDFQVYPDDCSTYICADAQPVAKQHYEFIVRV
jgi:hypothetical protein